jgi:hypothetical protein
MALLSALFTTPSAWGQPLEGPAVSGDWGSGASQDGSAGEVAGEDAVPRQDAQPNEDGAPRPAEPREALSQGNSEDPAASAVALEEGGDRDNRQNRKRERKAKKVKGATVVTKAGTLRLKGRVFARAALVRQEGTVIAPSGLPERRDVESLDMTIPTARIALKYRAPVRWVSAEIEYDIADEEMKDAFLAAKATHFEVTAGQFKMPISAIELASNWEIPLARRGLLNDILLRDLQIAGRRPGVLVGLRTGKKLQLRLSGGAFQGSWLADPSRNDFDPVERASLHSQNLVVRGELRVRGLRAGAFYSERVNSSVPFEVKRLAVAGADLDWETTYEGGGLHLWAEGFVGESPFEHRNKPADEAPATFFATRLLVASRLGGLEDDAPYIEAFAQFGLIDPDTKVTDDFAGELAAGINVGYWDRARITLQVERHTAFRNFPESIRPDRDPNRTALLAQAGVAF